MIMMDGRMPRPRVLHMLSSGPNTSPFAEKSWPLTLSTTSGRGLSRWLPATPINGVVIGASMSPLLARSIPLALATLPLDWRHAIVMLGLLKELCVNVAVPTPTGGF
jgi:hypothetical protein